VLKPELVDRAVAAIKGYAQYQYFFEHLDSPEWLEPLAARGLFKEPPPPEKVDQYVRLPFWPESRYLVRMAAIAEARATVVRIAREIPKTENSRVYDDIIDMALALPAGRAAELLDQIAVGVQLPIKLVLEHRIGDLIKHLAAGGQAAAALRLTSLILALAPDPRAERQDEEVMLLSPEPQPLVRDWYYARIIETSLEALVQAAGLAAVRLFVDLLDDAIRLSRKSSENADDAEDYLYITCPNIEHGRGRDDIPVILIAAVRDAAEQVITADAAQFAAVIRILDTEHWVTFRRLKLHLCRVFPQSGLAVAEAMLTDAETLLRGSLQHEIVLLLKTSFGRFSGETQQRILSIMEAGFPEDALRRWLEITEQPVTDENIRRLADMGRRDRYAILQGQLPPDYQQKLNELAASLGEPRALGEPIIGSFGAVGAQSPKSDAEMEAMSVEEILDFMSSWKAGKDIFQPTAEGLGKALMARLAKDPAPFLAHAKQFEGLDPTYVRAFLGGVHSALRAKTTFDWQPVLELAAWVVQRPREIPGREGELMVTDPDWGWTRDAILDLLTAGFDLDLPGHLPYVSHPMVWRVLQPLTEDPNPSTADEGGKNFNPRFLSINSTRGRAMHAALECARWRRLLTDPERKADKKPLLTFNEMPEVREVLEAHLDVNREPTLTVRSVYGHRLNLIAALDFEWFRGNLGRIFPTDDPPRFNAAWDDYITANQPNTTLLPTLIPFHQRALARVGQEANNKDHRDPADALAEHLMVYYWNGRIDFDTPDGLLREFYGRAPDASRGHAMWFIGTSVQGWTDAPPEAYAHLQELFNRRLAAAKAAASPDAFQKELRNFGRWFTSEKFDERWSVEMLVAALEIAKKAEPDMSVVKRLADLCPRYPVECVAALRLMIEGDREGWLLLGVEDDARRVLKGAIDSNNEDGLRVARRLIEDLIAKGQFSFRQLLS
jgi:hypothetical protein